MTPKMRLRPVYNKHITPEDNPLDPNPAARRDLSRDFQESLRVG